MPAYQFIILISLIVLFAALTMALFILLIKVKKKERELTSKEISSAVYNTIANFESRLNIRSDAAQAEHSRDIEQLRTSLSDAVSARMDSMSRMIGGRTEMLASSITDRQASLEKLLCEKQDSLEKHLSAKQDGLQSSVGEQLSGMRTLLDAQGKRTEERLQGFESGNAQQIGSLEAALKEIRETLDRQLDSIRGVVNEKLQQTLNERLSESFKRVDERLAEVYKGLGEMQTLAASVGDLKKVLSNVKTRGILGEIRLQAILEEILAPEQYVVNFDAGKGGRERVEFAIKLPNDGAPVYLPIDSKFPADKYAQLMDAYETGNIGEIENARKALKASLTSFAKDIFDKYINPPLTTNFAVMFLPTEGLYAEAVRLGLIEELQSRFRVNIAGPSTMAALLNSLQMGFRTLALQKRSSEVWDLLAEIKKEFKTFDAGLESTRKALADADKELDRLIGTRTRRIRQALDKVEQLPGVDGSTPFLPGGTDAPADAD